MCIRELNLNNIFSAGVILALTCAWQTAGALTSDKDQAIEIVADMMELDDIENTSVYTGDVIVIQGSIRMTGDKMTVYFTAEDDMDTLIMEGNPATYRQLPDDSKIYDEGEALRMEYYELKNLVILIERAKVTQEGSQLSGNRIEYDTELSQVRATSRPRDKNDTEAATTPETNGRVKIIIPPKKDP